VKKLLLPALFFVIIFIGCGTTRAITISSASPILEKLADEQTKSVIETYEISGAVKDIGNDLGKLYGNIPESQKENVSTIQDKVENLSGLIADHIKTQKTERRLNTDAQFAANADEVASASIANELSETKIIAEKTTGQKNILLIIIIFIFFGVTLFFVRKFIHF
jgi:hypothetical protein